jgi:hypothetical protein
MAHRVVSLHCGVSAAIEDIADVAASQQRVYEFTAMQGVTTIVAI